MPRGVEGIRRSVQQDRPRTENVQQSWFRLDEEESARVRFLEPGQDLAWAWCHELPGLGRPFGKFVACRDQNDEGASTGEACPGCERILPRTRKGWVNVIWRGVPAAGDNDRLAVWSSGILVLRTLARLDEEYGDLTSRDFIVTRHGLGLRTRYTIQPVNPTAGPVAMSEADMKLASAKVDFTPYVTPLPYDIWGVSVQAGASEDRPDISMDVSPFRDSIRNGERPKRDE
jgi:hypothetical protein